jgi:transcriptional regulator with XRE-family HTH domain
MASFGERIRLLREEQNLGQKEIAALLNVSVSTVGKYENELRTPPPKTIHALADFFHVSTDYLLGRTEVRDPLILNIMPNLPEQAREEIEEYIIYISHKYGTLPSRVIVDQPDKSRN